MILRRTVVVGLLLTAVAPCAMASYLRLEPAYKLRIDERAQKLSISWTVKNEGDEAAVAVALDFPTLNQAYTLASELAPQGLASQTLTFSFAQLGIDKPGDYTLIYRVTYKDTNLFPFSAPHLLFVVRPPEPGRILRLEFGQSGDALVLSPQSGKKVKIKIQNASINPVSIDKLDSLSPVEVSLQVQDVRLPLQLQPEEQQVVTVRVHATQTLIGSTYALGVVASGIAEGKHFSEPMTFLARIQASFWNPRNIILGLILGVIAGSMLISLARRFLRRPVRSAAKPRA